MSNCVCQKKSIILKMIMALLDLKAGDIAKETHTSFSLVSRHISGERQNINIDIYLIEKCFHIKIKECSYEK